MEAKKTRDVLVSLLKSLDESDSRALKLLDTQVLKKALELVIELLDKDTPVSYRESVRKIGEYDSVSYKCTICGWNVELSDKYCKHCGQKLKR